MTPWIDFPDLPERQLDKIKDALWRLDDSIVIRIQGGKVSFAYDLTSLAVRMIPELAEGKFPEFLLKQTSANIAPKSFAKSV